MRVFVLLTLACLAAGSSPWKENQEYRYDIYSRTLTGLPDLRNQYVGDVMKAQLILQATTRDQILGKLVNMAHAKFHGDLDDGPDTMISEDSLNYKNNDEMNNKPFIWNVKNGVSQNLKIDSSMTNDQVNHLKGILSQLQVDVTGQNLIQCRHNQLPEAGKRPNAFYKTMEASVTGHCETVYDMEPLPEYTVDQTYPTWSPQEISQDSLENKDSMEYFQIVKTLNYSNCEERKGFHFGFSGLSKLKVNTNRMGDFFNKEAISRVVASGSMDQYTIHYAYTTNRVAVSPIMYQKQQAMVVSQIALRLQKMEPISTQIEEPKNPAQVKNLIYTYNLPSDNNNQIRTGNENFEHRPGYGSSSQSSEEHGHRNSAPSQERRQNSQERGNRRFSRQISDMLNGRSKQDLLRLSNYHDGSSSSSEEEEFSRPRQFQPKPTMQEAPEIPLYHYTVGNQGHGIQSDPNVDIVSEARKLSIEISSDIEKQEDVTSQSTLEKFDILVDIIRTMNYQQIQEASKRLESANANNNEREQTPEKVFQDAVSEAGTGPAVNMVLNWISDRRVNTNDANEYLSNLPRTILTPTSEIVRKYWNFVKSMQGKPMHANAVISFTDFVRRAHVDKQSSYNYYPVQSFGPFYPELEQLVTRELIPNLSDNLKQSVQQKNHPKTLLYIGALGNTAHPDILAVYEKYLEQRNVITEFQRTAIVLSLHRMTEIFPSIVRPVLFKIYANVEERPETRSVAVLLLTKTTPSVEMLQRIAEYTHEDPSEIVQSVVKSAIESLANTRNVGNSDLQRNAEAVRKFLNPKTYGNQYTRAEFRQYVAKNMNLIHSDVIGHIGGGSHSIPEMFGYYMYKNYGGLKVRNIEIGAIISNVDEFLALLPSKQTNEDNKSQERNPNNSEWSARNIAKSLNIKLEDAEELEGQILYNIMNKKTFIAFDEKSLKNYPEKLKEIISNYRSGINRLYNRNQITLAFPLVTGYPFVYTHRMPTLRKVGGNIQVSINNQQASLENIVLRNPKMINISSSLDLMLGSEQIAKVGFLTPFNGQRYVAGYVRKAMVRVPLNLKLDVDIENRQISGKLNLNNNGNDHKVYHESAWPFTVSKNCFDRRPAVEAKDLKLINSRQTRSNEIVIGEQSTGMAFAVKVDSQLPSQNVANVDKMLQTQGMLSVEKMPLNYQATNNKIRHHEMFSAMSLLPYMNQQSENGGAERQFILSVMSLPYADELTTRKVMALQGWLSLMNLPFADNDSLKETSKHRGIMSLGEMPWPIATLDQYSLNIRQDTKRSTTDSVKFSLNFAYKADVNGNGERQTSNKLKGPAAFSEENLAYNSDSAPNSENRRQQLVEKAVQGIAHASVTTLDAALVFEGKDSAEYFATFVQADSPVDPTEKLLVHLSGKPVKQQERKQIAITYIGEFPKTPNMNFDEAMKHDSSSKAKIQVWIGNNDKSTGSEIVLRARMSQSPEYKEHLRNSNLSKRCRKEMKNGSYQMPSCMNATYQANLLDKINVEAELKNPTPEVKNITNHMLSLLRLNGFWNLDENVNMKGKENQLNVAAQIHPNHQEMDLTLQTGEMVQFYGGLPIHPALNQFLNIHPGLDFEERRNENEREYGNACVVDKKRILTFDNVITEQNIGKCWHAMVQYLPTQNKNNEQRKNNNLKEREVSVLLRQSNDGKSRDVLISVRNRRNDQTYMVKLTRMNSAIQMNVNDKKYQISEETPVTILDDNNHMVLRAYGLPGREAKIEIHNGHMKVHFDGENVRVDASSIYRKHIAGLCGLYNGEKSDDMMTPRRCVLRKEKLFAPSWAIIDKECDDNDVKRNHEEANSARCIPVERHSSGNVISNFEAGREIFNRGWHHRWSHSGRRSRLNERKSSMSAEQNQDQSLPSSEQSQNKPNRYNSECTLKRQVQYVEENGKICFTTETLPACPSNCKSSDKIKLSTPVHCREITDSVAQKYKQQINMGVNPDISSKSITKNITFNSPKRCLRA